jgi:hypothetical protein
MLAGSLFLEIVLWAFIVGFRSMYEATYSFILSYWIGFTAINMMIAGSFIALTSTLVSSKKNRIVVICGLVIVILFVIVGYAIITNR